MNYFNFKQGQGLKATRRQTLTQISLECLPPLGLRCSRKNRAELLVCARAVKCQTTVVSVFPSHDNAPNGRTRRPFVNSKMV